MSLGQISKTGAKVPIAGLNGLSGELVPSVSYYQSGRYTPTEDVVSQTDIAFEVTFANEMPDTDYVVVFGGKSYSASSGSIQATVRSQTKTGFSGVYRNVALNTLTVASGAFTWQAFKLMTDESRALDEAAIAANTTDIASLKELTGIGGNNKRLDDTVDLNDIKEPGTYCWTSSVPTNAPSSVAATMIVQRISSDTVVQFVIEAKAGNIYKRGMYGSWQSWVQLKTSDSTKDIEFVDVASFEDMRALPNNKFYQMRVSSDITNDAGTVTVPRNSRCIPVYKTSGDLQLVFYSAYPVTSAAMFAVFLNSNGLNNVAKILG